MILVIGGATGSGKSALAIALAKKLNGVVINGDAFQVYQELSIATAKPTPEERAEAPHLLFDFVPLSEDYSVYRYQKDCRSALKGALAQGKTPIIAGGTGLYIRSALYDYSFPEEEEAPHPSLDRFSNEELHAYLEKIDPEEAKKVHPNNRVRAERAIEIYLREGKSKSEFLASQRHQPIYQDVHFFGISQERDSLYESVEERVERMFARGLVEEDRRLVERYGRAPHAFRAIGVKELFPYFDGSCTLEEAKAAIKRNTRHYVKRQFTFFGRQFPMKWVSGEEEILSLLAQGGEKE